MSVRGFSRRHLRTYLTAVSSASIGERWHPSAATITMTRKERIEVSTEARVATALPHRSATPHAETCCRLIVILLQAAAHASNKRSRSQILLQTEGCCRLRSSVVDQPRCVLDD